MAGIALAAVTTADPCPRVGVTIDGLDDSGESVITVWRSVAGETRRPVRGLRAVTVVDATFVTDYEAPLGREVTYALEVISGAVVPDTLEATVTLATDSAWLQDPLDPSTAVPVDTHERSGGLWLSSDALRALDMPETGSLVRVLGASLPVLLGGSRAAATGVPFDVIAGAIEASNALQTLLQQASPILLRTPPNVLELSSLTYLRTAARRLPLMRSPDGGHLTRWSLTGDLVQPPSVNLLVPTWTYEQVAELWATYADAAAAGRTYLDWMKDPTP